jgi:phospholipid/cholesterol/gamma-HCH transport system ATP-binding protein
MSNSANPKISVPKVSVRGLKKSFGRKVVLDGIDFDVGHGESLVIIGGSGTGKSVTVKCVLGLIDPDAGSIKIDGQEVTSLSRGHREELMQKFGMLFQGAALFDSLTVWENVAFGLIQGRGMDRRKAKDVAMQKLGLARAIAAEPEIIIFDEPTTGLDPIMGDVINDLIVKCVKDLGATAISITHDMASARKIADRIAMIHKGRIIWNGTASDIDHSGNPFVDQFIHGRATGPIQMEIRAL